MTEKLCDLCPTKQQYYIKQLSSQLDSTLAGLYPENEEELKASVVSLVNMANTFTAVAKPVKKELVTLVVNRLLESAPESVKETISKLINESLDAAIEACVELLKKKGFFCCMTKPVDTEKTLVDIRKTTKADV